MIKMNATMEEQWLILIKLKQIEVAKIFTDVSDFYN